MALKKSIEMSSGITVECWDITKVEWNKFGSSLVILSGWINREAMDDNKTPVENRGFNFTFTDFPYLSDIFDKIKESRLENRIITEEIPAVLDENGVEITPAIPAVYGDVETNEFFGALKI